jgi:hypothetical protein
VKTTIVGPLGVESIGKVATVARRGGPRRLSIGIGAEKKKKKGPSGFGRRTQAEVMRGSYIISGDEHGFPRISPIHALRVKQSIFEFEARFHWPDAFA